jgi:carbamoylphosphate synthase large subunit
LEERLSRASDDNVIIICSENFDPMGIHTGTLLNSGSCNDLVWSFASGYT